MADLFATAREVGNFDPGPDAAANQLGAVGEPADRTCDRAGEQQRQHDHDRGGDAAHLEDREALGGDHLVDVVALRRQHQRAVDGARAQHGTATETITSPRALTRTIERFWPWSASPTSA